MALTTRTAGVSDAQAIASIHVRAWQSAYRGIVPAAFLDNLSIAEREGLWRQRLEHGDRAVTFIAEEHDQVLGWITVGPSRDADAQPETGELYGLYIGPEHWRKAVGRRLYREGARHLRTAGCAEMTLWVLSGNVGARAFYNAVGVTADADVQQVLQLGGVELLEVRMRANLTADQTDD